MKFLGFHAYITVDGVELPQYDVRYDEDAETATCWIPSEAGRSFAVNWRHLESRPFKICGQVYIDGSKVGGKICSRNGSQLLTQDNTITSSTTTRPLLFAPIQLTDDDSYLESDGIKDLGDIVLCMVHVEAKGKREPTTKKLPIDEKIHERSKKALVHRATFGEEIMRWKKIRVTKTKNIARLATFKFRYRSIDVLRADGIAPPNPMAPEARRGKRKADEINRRAEVEEPEDDDEEKEQAELKALLARIDVIQSNLAMKGSNTKGAKKVKVEPKMRSPFVPGEVIDLT